MAAHTPPVGATVQVGDFEMALRLDPATGRLAAPNGGINCGSAHAPPSTLSAANADYRYQEGGVVKVAVRWCAPEVLRPPAPPPPGAAAGEAAPPWSEASDVWAFGVTMWEVFSHGAEPFAALGNEQVSHCHSRRALA